MFFSTIRPNLEHHVTAAAVAAADLVLVVTSPSPADIWEAEEAVQFARAKNKDVTIRVLFLIRYARTQGWGECLDDAIFWSTERVQFTLDWENGEKVFYVDTDRHF